MLKSIQCAAPFFASETRCHPLVRMLHCVYLPVSGGDPFGQRPRCVKRVRDDHVASGFSSRGTRLRPSTCFFTLSFSFAPAISAMVGKKSICAQSAFTSAGISVPGQRQKEDARVPPL